MNINRSKTYLLPLLSEFVHFDLKLIEYLLNTYMFLEGEKDCLCILHEFSFKDPTFTSYEHKLINNKLFIKHIDINNKVLYVFKFPDEYLKEYNLFKEGKYSEFDESSKKLILRFWTQIYENNPNAARFLIKLRQILNKDEKLKQILEKDLKIKISNNQELGEIMNNNDETYKLKDEN